MSEAIIAEMRRASFSWLIRFVGDPPSLPDVTERLCAAMDELDRRWAELSTSAHRADHATMTFGSAPRLNTYDFRGIPMADKPPGMDVEAWLQQRTLRLDNGSTIALPDSEVADPIRGYDPALTPAQNAERGGPLLEHAERESALRHARRMGYIKGLTYAGMHVRFELLGELDRVRAGTWPDDIDNPQEGT